MSEKDINSLFGAKYFEPNFKGVIKSDQTETYSYQVFAGSKTKIDIDIGDCVFGILDGKNEAFCTRGPSTIEGGPFSVLIRGYSPFNRRSEIRLDTVLPYVNGCSTRQIFHPERPGDPTMQMLKIPPHSREQVHHIHSTARVVYILEGEGYSVVGMDAKFTKTHLKKGMICILNKMCPHHFETEGSELYALPIHVWSSHKGAEFDHPMFNGTFMTS